MIEKIYGFIDAIFPFSWAQYEFMKSAFLAIILITPIFALIGTMVVTNRLSFFSDALGHSMLTGVAIGTIFSVTNPMFSMIIFAAIFAISFVKISNESTHSQDTVIGVLSSIGVSVGIILLSKNGGFAKYSSYLTGDLLSISRKDVVLIFFIFVIVLTVWFFIINKFLLAVFNKDLALSKGVNVKFYKNLFIMIMALVITFFIKWLGILLVNSMLILPAAAARNVVSNMRKFYIFSVIFSMISGVGGLIFSYYLGVPSGALIVLISGMIFFITLVFRKFLKFNR